MSALNCPVCDSAEVEMSRVERDNGLGLESIRLVNVPFLECGRCGEGFEEFPAYRRLIRQAVELLCQLDSRLTGQEIAFVRHALNRSQQELAELLGVHTVTLSRWETGHSEVPAPADRLLRALAFEHFGRVRPVSLSTAPRQRNRERPITLDVEQLHGETYTYETPHTFGGTSHTWVMSNDG